MAAVIDAATFGIHSWEEVPAAFSRYFPGSWVGLHNINFSEISLNFLSAHNIEPQFFRSFQEHFVYVNPWNPHWSTVKSGVISLSERVAPARMFAHTEFFNDWLLPQKNVEAAMGLKIDGDHGESIQFMMHYPLSHSDKYDDAGAEVLRRTRGNLLRSIEFGRLMRSRAESAAAGAALVERGLRATFVVDGDRTVREANQQAVDLFSSATALSVRFDRIYLSNKEADSKFGNVLAALAAGIPTDGSRISFRTADGAWQVALAALPGVTAQGGTILSLIPPRRMVLVLVTDLSSERLKSTNLSALSAAFRLTPSEVAFCRRLLLGESVAEAAGQLGITIMTARSRLKAIFHKTDTSRQGQLMLLLTRLT
ncbi:helix-turn-helix transcriptional regulator [Mesorhizobium sp. Root157]|uniref:helix-turn-helix transcriptional regulator n=1 Tax=Mesorhizobium sp. Root157 TaxID=1736477 RepID=UPI0012E3828B|nr:helix-turn-helix transcriptional regulator [Mesorhizobium sp. Root157]